MLDVENSSIDKNNSPKMKNLLEEDNASMRRFLEITLQRADYEVIPAEGGGDLKEMLLENLASLSLKKVKSG